METLAVRAKEKGGDRSHYIISGTKLGAVLVNGKEIYPTIDSDIFIDELAIWNRELTPKEKKWLANKNRISKPLKKGLNCYYKFDE